MFLYWYQYLEILSESILIFVLVESIVFTLKQGELLVSVNVSNVGISMILLVSIGIRYTLRYQYWYSYPAYCWYLHLSPFKYHLVGVLKMVGGGTEGKYLCKRFYFLIASRKGILSKESFRHEWSRREGGYVI